MTAERVVRTGSGWDIVGFRDSRQERLQGAAVCEVVKTATETKSILQVEHRFPRGAARTPLSLSSVHLPSLSHNGSH